MKTLIENFTKQLSEAILIGERSKLNASHLKISNILISGLGGSGIGGTIVSEITSKISKVPILVNKDYFLPTFVNEHSLVIISSYSGNTEETLQAFEEALQRKAKITCITSGGKILEKAIETGTDYILLPGGMPPRACLGYSFTELFYVLQFHQIIGPEYLSYIQDAIVLLEACEMEIRMLASQIANRIKGSMPVLYSATGTEGVVVRFRQQLNENAKILCWHHVIPEMNHNELVGWTTKNENLSVIIFRNENDYYRTQKRTDILRDVVLGFTPNVMEIYSKGENAVERALYFVHLGDWVSYYLAELRGVDVTEVKIIDFLKKSLEKIGESK